MAPRRLLALPLLVLVSAACGAATGRDPLAPAEPAEPSPSSVIAGEAPEPEAPEAPAAQPAVPATPTPTPVRYSFPSSGRSPVSAWRPPPYVAPRAVRLLDHFFLARPIPSGNVNWAHPLYRYGGTYFGDMSVHTGVDLGADRNTPVLASGPGVVIWNGHGLMRGYHDPRDPYGLAIVIRHDFGHEDQLLFTVYAHLNRSFVGLGQRVDTGERIGVVGETGHASGAHLHFEVRLGENSFYTTRNPELWLVPPEGWGVLAGRVTDGAGAPLREHLVLVRSLDTQRRWQTWTYAAEPVQPDDDWGENFAMGDLPAGPYEVTISYQSRTYNASLFVYPGQTNFLVFRGARGFTVEPTPTPADFFLPPDLR